MFYMSIGSGDMETGTAQRNVWFYSASGWPEGQDEP